jgi:hypothetical protein
MMKSRSSRDRGEVGALRFALVQKFFDPISYILR